jgi:TRAP-type mannitol/chloroaromatic compound transport system substrate-binding protein
MRDISQLGQIVWGFAEITKKCYIAKSYKPNTTNNLVAKEHWNKIEEQINSIIMKQIHRANTLSNGMMKIKQVKMITDNIKKATLGPKGSLDAVTVYARDATICV